MKIEMTVFDEIKEGKLPSVAAYFQSNPDKINMLGEGNRYYRDKTPLMYALQCMRSEIANWLIDAGADVKFRMPAGQKTPVLMYGVRERIPVEILEKMLANGSDPNACDCYGETPIIYVLLKCCTGADKNAMRKLKLLLKYGADPNILAHPEDPDLDPLSPVQYAHKQKGMPAEVFRLLGTTPPHMDSNSSDMDEDIVFDSTEQDCESYQQALWQGFVIALKKGFKHWLCVDFQGGTEAGIMTEPFYIKRRQFLVKFDQLQAALNEHNIDDPWLLSITSDEDGFCKLPSQLSAKRLAQLFTFVIENMYDLPKFEGDYNVLFEYDHDFHYYAYKNAVERALKEGGD